MPISFEQWMVALKRHWRISALAFVGVMSLAALVIVMAPRAYRSEAKLLLRIGRESVSLDPTASTVGDTLNLHHTRENAIQSAIGVMESREILGGVVEQVGAGVVLNGMPSDVNEDQTHRIGAGLATLRDLAASIDPVPEREKAIRVLSKGIGIYAPSESSVVTIFYKTDSADVAQDVVAAWVDHYIAQHAKVNRNQGSYAFFESQGKVLSHQLAHARDALLKAKNESNLVTIEGQQRLLEAELLKIRQGLLETESEMAASASRVTAYDKILSEFDDTITAKVTGKSNEARDQMRNQLFELEVLEKDLRSKFRPGHPKLVAIERQLSESRTIVGEQTQERTEVTRSVNPAHQQLFESQMRDQATLAGLAQKRSSLLEKRGNLLMEIAALNESERTISGLTNEVRILEDRYARHAEKLEQARLDEVLSEEQITSVSVVQPATLEQRPVKPNKPVCAAVGFLAACAISLSLPILLESRAARRQFARTGTPGCLDDPDQGPERELRQRASRPSRTIHAGQEVQANLETLASTANSD